MKQLNLFCDLIERDISASDPVLVAGDFNDWREKSQALLPERAGLQAVLLKAYGNAPRTPPVPLAAPSPHGPPPPQTPPPLPPISPTLRPASAPSHTPLPTPLPRPSHAPPPPTTPHPAPMPCPPRPPSPPPPPTTHTPHHPPLPPTNLTTHTPPHTHPLPDHHTHHQSLTLLPPTPLSYTTTLTSTST